MEGGLPGLVGHAVNHFARGGGFQRHAGIGGGLLIPAAGAVPAEAGEVHHVDILHIRALAQVLDEFAEGGGLDAVALLGGELGGGA